MIDGWSEGAIDGTAVGRSTGGGVGPVNVGIKVNFEGAPLGDAEGSRLGILLGIVEGDSEGMVLG